MGDPETLVRSQRAETVGQGTALSPLQTAYWVAREGRDPLAGFTPLIYFEFDAVDLDLERLARALCSVFTVHPALRTAVTPEGYIVVLGQSIPLT